MDIGGGDNFEKLDLSHAHLHGGSQDIYKQLLFYWYLTHFSKISCNITLQHSMALNNDQM